MAVLQQSIEIQAKADLVERCIVDRDLMHRWLNPALRCDPVGDWSTDVGSRSRFVIQIPGWEPALESVVVERQPGLIVWGFDGFFRGCDRWHCQSYEQGTLLSNRFEFEIPNPLIQFGFNIFALRWTKQDMVNQLQRLKCLAEELRE